MIGLFFLYAFQIFLTLFYKRIRKMISIICFFLVNLRLNILINVTLKIKKKIKKKQKTLDEDI